jgi:hypothetical protein
MSTYDSAVLQIRQAVNDARRRLNLPQVDYTGVPTQHTCGRVSEKDPSCYACIGRSVSI